MVKNPNSIRTRQEKIKFLKGLITGENKIHELQLMQPLVFYFIAETQTYQNKKMNLEFTKEEFREYQKRHPGRKYIIVHRTIVNE